MSTSSRSLACPGRHCTMIARWSGSTPASPIQASIRWCMRTSPRMPPTPGSRPSYRTSGDAPSWRYFLGRLNGKPVATAKLFVGAGVAAVHHVVTLPEMRRRGIGTAMTLRVLHDARAMGYRVGVLTASPDGLGSYRRIGFRDYCWFRRYD